MPAPQLTDNEKRQILRYCASPKFAAAALAMAFASAVLILPLEMVDDLVFHNKGFDPAGLYTALAFVALNLVVFCYCTLSPKFGMRGKQWRSLQERLRVPQTETDRSAQVAGVLAAQAAGRLLKNSDSDAARGLGGAAEIAGAVGAVATAADILSEISGNAEAMAEAYGLPVPSAKKQLIAFVALPVAVTVGVYVPQFARGSQELQARTAAAAEQLALAEAAFGPVCERVTVDNPHERYQDYGYRAIAYLREGDEGAQKAYVYLSFNEEGTLTGVDYCEEIDPGESLEESLARAEKDFAELCAPLSGSGIRTGNPALLTSCAVPDDFKEAFLAGSVYEEVRVSSTDENLKTWCTFDTEPEADFDEYTRPTIRLSFGS